MANQICGIYLGCEVLKALVLRPGKKRGWTVLSGGSLALDNTLGDEEEALPPALKQLCKNLKISKMPTTVVLPKRQAIVRFVQLPSTSREELGPMARFEAERHIPFHPERHSTSYHVMRSMGVEGSEVLLAAADGPILNRALRWNVELGLRPHGITLSSAALVNSLLYHKAAQVADQTIALLSLGLDSLDIVLMNKGRVLFARSVTMNLRSLLESWLGVQSEAGVPTPFDLTRMAMAARMINCLDPEGHYAKTPATTPQPSEAPALVRSWLARLLQEIRRTWDFARREMQCPPIDLVAMTGEGATLGHIAEYLEKNIDQKVETFNPLEGLARSKGVQLPFGGMGMGMPFGAAIADHIEGGYRLDLTPTDYYRSLERKRTYRQLGVTGVLFVMTLGLLMGCYVRYKDIQRQNWTAYEELVDEMRPKVSELHEMQVKLGIIGEFINDKNSALAILDSITRPEMIPGRVSLSRVEYTKGSTVHIQGTAKNVPDINAYVGALTNSGHFADIVPSQTNMPIYNQMAYSFDLECPLDTKTAEGKKP